MGGGTFMNTSSRTFLFIAIFSLALIFYMLLPVIYEFFEPAGRSRLWMESSETGGLEFMLLILISALTALVLTFLSDSVYAKFRRWRRYNPKIGEILVALNYISEEELNKALAQQKLRLGEILVKGGRITLQQWRLALELQKDENKRIGEILRAQGAISEKDLRWALNEKNKKIGGILKEMNLITDYDIDCALMVEKKGRMDKSGRIIDMGD